jgi:anaerobic selenocysteine-containing dehydrogenase
MCKPRKLAAASMVLAAGLLIGCAGPGGGGIFAGSGPAGTSQTPAVSQSVAALEQSLTIAEKLATRYTSLPACGPKEAVGFVPRCHNPAIKMKIKALDNTAFNAVMAARNNEGLISLAVAAIGNLSSAVPGGN